MKSITNLNNISLASSILADDILEFHVARLLLIFLICGTNGRIDGLTKMAKLDFFVRYPQFFIKYCKLNNLPTNETTDYIESNMIRYHYGPWDQRYYQILGYLKSRNLINLEKKGNTIVIQMTDLGKLKANAIKNSIQFSDIVSQISAVNIVLGKKSGTQLKNLVYETFDEEIVQLKRGDLISYD